MGRIEAKELRIGNWVKNNKPRHNDKILVIESIGDNEKVNVFFRDYDLSDLEPIPLTEEWLLKLGFEKGDNYFLSPHEDSVEGFVDILCYDLNDFSFIVDASEYSGRCVECKHVHSLQNLYFALTGDELTLKTD